MKTLLLILNISLLLSCSKGVSPLEYKKYVEDKKNGLRISYSITDIQFSLQYKPKDYILLSEGLQGVNDEKGKNRLNELGEMQYYNFRIQSIAGKQVIDYNSKGDEQSQQHLAYLSAEVQNDFYILQGNDTLRCKLFNFVPNYNLAPYIDFVLGFDENQHPQSVEDRTFVYNDKVFGVGKVSFEINKESLIKIPNLKF